MHRFPVSLPLEEIVEGLNRVDGDSLATYSSMLATLAAEAQAGRLRIQPQRIATTAEPLLPEIRRAAQQTWGAPIATSGGHRRAAPRPLAATRTAACTSATTS